jgi:hypothetical protein
VGCFWWGRRDLGMEQPGHEFDHSVHLVLRLRMGIPLLHMLSLCAQRSFYLYFLFLIKYVSNFGNLENL